VAKKKRKKRTIQDVIEDIRELHEKEESGKEHVQDSLFKLADQKDY
jgi:hypothetical protein